MSTPRRRRAATIAAATCVLAALLTGCARADAAASGPMDTGNWTIDAHEAFDADSLDADRWTTCYWWDDGGCTNLGNNEAQWYVPGGVQVGGGHLTLQAQPARSTHLSQDFEYSSGMVTSGRIGSSPDESARQAFTYGYLEVRFRTPKGGGLWPAIWLLPVTNEPKPEIDLFEQYGDDTSTSSMTLHTVDDQGKEVVDRHYVHSSDLSVGWHTVGLEWTRGRLRWFLDGTQRFEVTGERVPDEPMYLLMNLAVGGNAGDPPTSTTFPASFLIDDVTFWRQT